MLVRIISMVRYYSIRVIIVYLVRWIDNFFSRYRK